MHVLSSLSSALSINRELVNIEGKIMRFAVGCKVKREEFLKEITAQFEAWLAVNKP